MSEMPERKPLPDDFKTTALNAAEIMMMLNEQVGIPLRATVRMDFQTLYDLFCSFAVPEDAPNLDHLIIIGDETADRLVALMQTTIDRLRPENRGVAHNVGIMSRSIALATLKEKIPADASLTTVEMALWQQTGETEVVLENVDAADYCREMNRIISQGPHGRSPVLD